MSEGLSREKVEGEKKMIDREKLIESIDDFIHTVDVNHWYSEELDEGLANHLIEEGFVGSPCKVGKWVAYELEESYGDEDSKEWYRCSECGKDSLGRCYEDEWYSFPIRSEYCPHCGAHMNGGNSDEN